MCGLQVVKQKDMVLMHLVFATVVKADLNIIKVSYGLMFHYNKFIIF